MRRIGATAGTVVVGTTAVSGSALSKTEFSDDTSIETDDVGRPQEQWLSFKAKRTDEFATVSREFPGSGSVSEVIKFRIEDSNGVHKGHRVTFGDPPNPDDTVGDGVSFVSVYLSDTFDSGARAVGYEEINGGIRTATSDAMGVWDVGTPMTEEVIETISEEVRTSISESNGERLRREEAMLGHPGRHGNAGGVLVVPVERNGEVVDRVTASLRKPTSAPTVERLEIESDVGTLDHVVCDPTGTICTNYCTILCGALTGLAGSACLAKCSATIAGMPISPACAGVCAAVVGGTCRATCANHAGH